MAKRNGKNKTPYWQTMPCPSWCGGYHKRGDGGSDRTHMGTWSREVRLSLYDAELYIHAPGVHDHIPVDLQVYLQQDFREFEPRVMVEPANSRSELSATQLTLDEALKLGKALLAAVERATR